MTTLASNPIIKILVRRDGLTTEEAIEQFQSAIEEFQAGTYGSDVDECLAQEFGLEPDYIFDFLPSLGWEC